MTSPWSDGIASDLDDWVSDDTGFEEPNCWGFNSYEHYKGGCRHFEEERHIRDLYGKCDCADCRAIVVEEPIDKP